MPAASPDILHDVFISYARKEADLGAAPLDAALQPRCRTWRDIRGIDPSQDFTAEIEKAIKASRRVVVCVTPDVEREDSFVRREIAYASYLKKPILVARFADVAPPINVFTHTWIDFFAGWDAAFARLLSWLGGKAVDTDRAAPSPGLPTDPYKAYLETLYEEIVESLRVSVFSQETITLRAVESVGDVPRKPRRLNPKFLASTLRDAPEPDPQHFDSLQEAYAHAHCDGRVLLLGEPGAGKTTTLLAFARDAAAARLSDPAQPLPVFARIAGWNSLDQTPLTDWLAGMYPELTASALHSLIETGRTLLLLDGLDELGSRRPVDPKKPDGEQYDPRERFLKALPATGKLILSSRTEEYRDIHQQAALNCAVRLEPLDDAQMQAYLADVPDLWPIIDADASLKDALRTPLLLALVRVGFEGSPAELRALGNLNAGDLNDRIWNAFIDKRWQHEQSRQPDTPLPYSAAELKERLGRAVVNALADSRTDYNPVVERDIGGTDSAQVLALALHLDLLRPAGTRTIRLVGIAGQPPPTLYRFLHLRLRDALAFAAAMTELRSVDRRSQAVGAKAADKLGDRRAVLALIAVLEDQNEADVDQTDTLILPSGRVAQSIPSHISARQNAADALGSLGDTRAVEPLIAALNDHDVNEAAAKALGQLGDLRAVAPLIDSLIIKMGALSWPNERAAWALGQLGDPRAVEPLITVLQGRDIVHRITAAESLGRIGDSRATDPLINAMHDRNEFVRKAAASALQQVVDSRSVSLLINALRDSDESVRNSVANALVTLGESALAPLIAALHDPDDWVRNRAAEALGQLGDARAVEPLLAALRDPDEAVRREAAGALGELRDARAVEPLLAALRDPDKWVRGRAAEALGALGDARAVEPLIAALRDPDKEVRREAAGALGVIGDARAVEPLITALHDADQYVRYDAAEALRKFPDHPAARQARADFWAGKLPPREE
jgi:HEAT repeat protein